MEKKKRPTPHEGIINYLRSLYSTGSGARAIVGLYADWDISCPPEAIADVIAALEVCRDKTPGTENMIRDAIANLRTQLAEHEAKTSMTEVVAEKSTPQSEEKFQNPAEPWSREGIFSVELERSLIPRLIPYSSSWITVEKKKDRTVANFRIKGKIKLYEGLMRIHVGADHFIWKRGSVKAIRDEDGGLLYKKGASRPPKPVVPATP